MKTDELIARLRTATVADTAESLYELMSAAADKIEVLDSLNVALAECLEAKVKEVQELQ